ncbi:MAG: beta-ketoacyl synthase chain length factor [Rubrivivax sp.]
MLKRKLHVLAHAQWSPTAAAPRPAPALLGANERRRAPDAVLMALQVAEAACAAAAVDAATVATVFASAHGDLGLIDALCRTLAADPLLLSPLRFHHSVHNAASGYFAIGAGNRENGTAVAAGPCSFAAGLLEAACLCAAEDRTVLLVGCDTPAVGPLQSVNGSRAALAVALLLAPQGSQPHRAIDWALAPLAAPLPPGNPMAAALPLLAALQRPQAAQLALPLSPHQGLLLSLRAQA